MKGNNTRMYINLKDLAKSAKINKPMTIAVAGAHDHVVLDALAKASNYIKFDVILIGIKNEINELLKQYNLNVKEVIDTNDLTQMGEFAVKCIRENKANVIMKGLVDTKYVLKPVVNSETGIKKSKLLSHVSLMTFENQHKSYFFTDGAMNIAPTAEQKLLIAENAVWVAQQLCMKHPKVAVISAVEKLNPKIQSTVDAEWLKSQPHNGYDLSGPFAIDNIASEEAAKHKGITDPVALNPDILLFPELVSGNVFYKTSVFFGNGSTAGCIIGANVPIILTSRADSAETKFNSILFGVLLNSHE